MVAFNYERIRTIADRRLIRYFGAKCKLRRFVNGVKTDRDCIAAIVEYTPHERSALTVQVDQYAVISAVGLTIPPDWQQDMLVTFVPKTTIEAQVLHFAQPIGKLAPAGTVVFWEGALRR